MTVDVFAETAALRGCQVVRAASYDAALTEVDRLLAGRQALIADVVAAERLGNLTPPADPWDAEVGVTHAVAASAETGTVALARGLGRPSATSILPLHSIVLVDSSCIVETYAELVVVVAGLEPRPSQVQLVTGPSRSGDVQGITVRGMHGPAALTLVVF